MADNTLEKLKLPIPNPYGTTVKIERVNMLIERAYKTGRNELLAEFESLGKKPGNENYIWTAELRAKVQEMKGSSGVKTMAEVAMKMDEETRKLRCTYCNKYPFPSLKEVQEMKEGRE